MGVIIVYITCTRQFRNRASIFLRCGKWRR